MNEASKAGEIDAALDQAVAEGGAYEVIRKRLLEQGKTLENQVRQLNLQREKEFGHAAMEVIGRLRVRSENNCVPRDIVRVGQVLLFGYNVFIGLKKQTQVADVFSLHALLETADGFDVEPAALQQNFLQDAQFVSDFQELYSYYKNSQLIQLQVKRQKLLATFQIGEKISDIRVFRWQIDNEGHATYIDNRGERDAEPPPTHDFEWTAATREDQISGKHPHISILDIVFVETVGGDLTVKVENNTEDGFGIYREPVDDQHQSLDDADIYYAKMGVLIVLKIKPYRENQWRYLVFNSRTETVTRIDALGLACIQLPEDHGIIFPGGYYLQDGENKTFSEDVAGFQFKNKLHSPNGEDVLYVFYEAVEGKFALFSYNLIRKTLLNPIYGHGYSVYEDGKAIIFRAESSEPTRVHPMQIWQTPFYDAAYAGQIAQSSSPLGKIGNAELVRGISDLFSICRAIQTQSVTTAIYEDLLASSRQLFDSYFWVSDTALGNPGASVKLISETAEQVLDEFEKVRSIRNRADQLLSHAESTQKKLISQLTTVNYDHPEKFVGGLHELRRLRGHLISLKEQRYIDLERIDGLQQKLVEELDTLGRKTVHFLNQDTALKPYQDDIATVLDKLQQVQTVLECEPLLEQLDSIGAGLDLLTELMDSLKVADATQRTSILEVVSATYAQLNQARAQTRNKRKALGSTEMVAEFSAQFNLFAQSITGALGLADTPQQCDEQLSRLLVRIEEMEGHFGEYEQFLDDILSKREELFETFESRKQTLLDQRQRRAQSLVNAAQRILSGIQRRAQNFAAQDALNSYFAADAMVLKITELAQQLRALDDSVNADDIEAKLKAVKEQATRSLRDKQDIFEDGGQVIKLGRHRFSVNNQELDITIVNKQERMLLHLIGSDYFEAIDDSELNKLSAYWQQQLISETKEVYRAEYLAALLLDLAETGRQGFSLTQLNEAALDEAALLPIIRSFAAERYQEGYEKGVHDVDSGKILAKLLPLREQVGLLRFDPKIRALAQVFWSRLNQPEHAWLTRARSAKQLSDSLASYAALDALGAEIQQDLETFINEQHLLFPAKLLPLVSQYLVSELSAPQLAFICSQAAQQLSDSLSAYLNRINHRQDWLRTLTQLEGNMAAQWAMAEAWLTAYLQAQEQTHLQRFVPEAVAMVLADEPRSVVNASLHVQVTGLLGEHPRLQQGTLDLSIDDFYVRMHHHLHCIVPEYKRFHEIRKDLIDTQRERLNLQQYQAKPLSSFVRNRLINEAYLPIVGDNLAKQMGAAGKDKRTDLMGLFMLISPPGYGKTTLMEYIANRLGLIFMKINCPSLGHDVHSLDSQQAPNATARQELEKLNLALEMGNNVMLYLDDIQHTHAEFLQKFIALCDGTRRIEGVWQGQSKTYNLRGKKFCVVMAGNPYTESGELFKIPDMLANRADIYNLGDILSGQEEIFALSFIENAMTSNPVLAPLATREMGDIYQLIARAQGRQIELTDLQHGYSAVEVNEITAVLEKLIIVRDVLLSVNQAYIASAASAENYRTEPPFKLQGSYRNMNKIAEKIVAVMDDSELQAVIDDHYHGEAQLLTTGAEENLLKLGAIRGRLDAEQTARRQAIIDEYAILRRTGSDDVDAATKVARQIAAVSTQLQALHNIIASAATSGKLPLADLQRQLDTLQRELTGQGREINIINEPVPGLEKAFSQLANTIDITFLPLISSMNKKIDLDLNILHTVSQLSADLKNWQQSQTKMTTHKADS